MRRMAHVSLHEFIAVYRDDIIRRCRARVAARSAPPPTQAEIEHGVPLFLDQLVTALRAGHRASTEIRGSAVLHGRDLLLQGLTIDQVVRDYGDVCQSITDLAIEMDAPIATEDFRTLNGCLDDAIAGAVTEYARERRDGESAHENQRLGFLTHELRNLTNTAMHTSARRFSLSCISSNYSSETCFLSKVLLEMIRLVWFLNSVFSVRVCCFRRGEENKPKMKINRPGVSLEPVGVVQNQQAANGRRSRNTMELSSDSVNERRRKAPTWSARLRIPECHVCACPRTVAK